MNLVSLVSIAVGLAGVSHGASPGEVVSNTAPVEQAAPALPASEKRVCKYQEELGSKLPKRVCMTKGEWDARARDIQDQVNTMQRKSHIPDRR